MYGIEDRRVTECFWYVGNIEEGVVENFRSLCVLLDGLEMVMVYEATG